MEHFLGKEEAVRSIRTGSPLITSSLKDFRVRLVPLKEIRHLYETGHYLHRVRVGRQLNYAIEKNGKLFGAICYALPMMRTGYCGIDISKMIEFARLYLIENIAGLAVYAISATLRKIKKDWTQQFPSAAEPCLIVSWHDTTLHIGTVYKAANFLFYRNTERPRKRGMRYGETWAGPRKLTQDYAHVKGIWFFALDVVTRNYLYTLPDNKSV